MRWISWSFVPILTVTGSTANTPATAHIISTEYGRSSSSGGGSGGESYSTNAACLRHKCVNPIFPAFRMSGKNVMEEQESFTFACVDNWKSTRRISRFCTGALDYEFSVRTGAEPAAVLVEADQKASLAYISHLNGVGIDAWDYQEPWAENTPECVKAIWKLSCYTYFPKCNNLDNSKYLRPCHTACENYIQACGVQCCDEGVKCVFSHDERQKDDSKVTTSGYVNHVAPSLLCTGMFSGAASHGSCPQWVLILLLLCASMMFQGWDRYGGYVIPAPDTELKLPERGEAYWRTQPDYTIDQSVKQPDGTSQGVNSCTTPGVRTVDVCSGNGLCYPFNPDDLAHPLLLCKCNKGWAGMECNHKRLSQVIAWNLSLFFGWLGVDQFYLGYPLYGTLKLMTLGGFGTLWLYDIAFIGSGEIYAANFRVANDMPHWVYVIASISAFTTIGFAIFVRSLYHTVRLRRRLASQGKFPT